MRYYKHIENGYILAIGTGGNGTEITETEYNEIMSVIQNKPAKTETTDHHLREDLTWEVFEVEPVDPVEEELTPEELLQAAEVALTEGVNSIK